jgi:hypothetical protein
LVLQQDPYLWPSVQEEVTADSQGWTVEAAAERISMSERENRVRPQHMLDATPPRERLRLVKAVAIMFALLAAQQGDSSIESRTTSPALATFEMRQRWQWPDWKN